MAPKTKPAPAAARFTRAPRKEMRVPYRQLHIEDISVDLLRPAAWNHPDRSDPTSSQCVTSLLDAIVQTEICCPVFVTPAGPDGLHEVIEGHRRTAALKHGGYTHAPCIQYEGDPQTIFAFINDQVKPPSSSQKLYSYLRSPGAVTPQMRTRFLKMEQTVGRAMMEELVTYGGSYATYQQAGRAAKFCGLPHDTAFIKKALRWIITTNSTLAIRLHMKKGGGCPLTLRNLIEGRDAAVPAAPGASRVTVKSEVSVAA